MSLGKGTPGNRNVEGWKNVDTGIATGKKVGKKLMVNADNEEGLDDILDVGEFSSDDNLDQRLRDSAEFSNFD